MRNEDWLEIQSEVAAKLTERECRRLKIRCWVKSRGEEYFRPEAQDLFNDFRDEIEDVMTISLGDRSEDFMLGYATKRVSAKQRRTLVKSLTEAVGFDVSDIIEAALGGGA